VSLEQIDFACFNTPLAWYSAFCARVSSAAASVVRWGDVGLGPLPACQTLEEYQTLQQESLHPRASSLV
jgi:hypothetical protein